MSTDRLFTWKNPWFAASVGITGAMAVLALIVGFVVLPYATTSSQLTSLWDAICSAAGVPRTTVVSEVARPDFMTSNVVMNSQMFGPPDARSVGRGATLAMQCAICHGSNRQGQVDTPNLEGQPGSSLYKQLRDFKVAARTNAIMSPFALARRPVRRLHQGAAPSLCDRRAAQRHQRANEKHCAADDGGRNR
jgi:cytochrome c553